MKKPPYVTKESLKTFITNALEEDIQDGDHSTPVSYTHLDVYQRQNSLLEGLVFGHNAAMKTV